MKKLMYLCIFLTALFHLPVYSMPQQVQGIRQWIAEKNAEAPKRKITDKIEAYFKSSLSLSGLKVTDEFTDPAKKNKIPVNLVKEICSFKNDETLYGGIIDSEQPGKPLFVFTDYAFYVIGEDIYLGFMNQAKQIDNEKIQNSYLAADYSQLKKMKTRDFPQHRQYQIGDFIFTSGFESRIPECLDKMISYIKSETVIFRIEKSLPAEKTHIPFFKGHTLLVFTDRQSDMPAVGRSLDALAGTGANCVCIVTNGQMKTFDTPQIVQSSKDDITRSVIQMARQRNLKIILKPMIDPQDEVWRAWINFFDQDGKQDLARWQQWWDSYEQFIVHQAQIAQEAKAELFCLGCEMGSTEQFESKWRYLIGRVREIYHGTLTYNINHWPLDHLKWWDALDVISISAYYHLENYVLQAGRQTQPDNPLYRIPLEDMKAGFAIVRENLRQYSEKWGKPIFFIECGVCNGKGCARAPWTHPNPSLIYDQEEQADYYTAMFESFFSEPWFAGYAWWAWPTFLYDKEQAKTDVSFTIYGKAAENVVKEWYAKPRQDPNVPVSK